MNRTVPVSLECNNIKRHDAVVEIIRSATGGDLAVYQGEFDGDSEVVMTMNADFANILERQSQSRYRPDTAPGSGQGKCSEGNPAPACPQSGIRALPVFEGKRVKLFNHDVTSTVEWARYNL